MTRPVSLFAWGMTLVVGAASGSLARDISADFLADLPSAEVVILGEIHDNPTHHANQARIVAAYMPSALVFEMLSPEQALRVQGVDRTNAPALERALDWNASGWPDFALYAPIFAASGRAALYGAAVPRTEVRRAMTEGAVAVFGDEADRFGLATPLSAEDQAAREAEQMAAHCNALPAEMVPGMVAAQRFRDAAFARTALKALRETGGPVVVIAGSGHADTGQGMPVYLAAAAPEVSVLSIGQLEAEPRLEAPFDLWIVTEPAPRADPCAAFGGPKP